MIKNVIFDFGQVMVHFSPRHITERYITGDDARLIESVVFDRLYWNPLDSGDISDAELMSACRARLPERLHAVAETVYYNWIYNLPEIDGMRDTVRALKARGYRVFLLSNIASYFAEHADEFALTREFDGCVYSGPIRMTKPSADIYNYTLDKYGLAASETLFVDDSPINIAGAEAVGIRGYLFDGNVGRLREYLDKI